MSIKNYTKQYEGIKQKLLKLQALTMEDLQRILKILAMCETINDRHYNKMLECTQG